MNFEKEGAQLSGEPTAHKDSAVEFLPTPFESPTLFFDNAKTDLGDNIVEETTTSKASRSARWADLFDEQTVGVTTYLQTAQAAQKKQVNKKRMPKRLRNKNGLAGRVDQDAATPGDKVEFLPTHTEPVAQWTESFIHRPPRSPSLIAALGLADPPDEQQSQGRMSSPGCCSSTSSSTSTSQGGVARDRSDG